METFCDKLGSLLQDKAQEGQLQLKKEYNIFIIGYQSSGKSTLANALSDQQLLYFDKVGNNQFIPINNHYFPIAKEDGIGTQQPTSIEKSEYQIWDFPGYGMEEDSIETRILQIIMMNKVPAIHIIVVFPYSQFTQDRGQNIIQLLNLISQKDLPASIIISKVPTKIKLELLIGKLQTQLSQEEIIYTDEAQELLKQMKNNNRIQIFNYPQTIEEFQQFKEENIKQIQQLVFDKKYFNKVKIQFRFLSNQQIIIKEYASLVQQKLKEINQNIINNTIKINISRIKRNISDQQLNQDEIDYQQLQQQKDKYLAYNKLFQQINDISQNDDIIDSQINKINDFFISQETNFIENSLFICCASYSLNQLKDIYEQNQSIKEIFILSFHQFIVDCDIKMPGVHLYIKCKQFRVNVKSVINLKGENGQFLYLRLDVVMKQIFMEKVSQEEYSMLRLMNIFALKKFQQTYLEEMEEMVKMGVMAMMEKMVKMGKRMMLKKDQNSVKQRLKKFMILILHYKGTPGTIGGNSGCGGQGGQQGMKGIAQFNNLKLQQNNVLDNNTENGLNGKDGRPGNGGQDGIDYIGLYQDVKSIVPEISKEVIKNMNPLEIGLSIVMPFFAVGYFGTLGLANAASLVHAKVQEGWIFKMRCEDQINMAPSGIIEQQQTFLKQQQICSNQDMTYYHNRNLDIFIKTQDVKIKEIRNQFQGVQFLNETINIMIGGTDI